MDHVLDHRISRRDFLAAGAAGGAAVLLGGAGSVVRAKSPPPLLDEAGHDWFDASIHDLGRLMRRHELSSEGLTAAYLARIATLNPTLHAVIETNPDALRIARHRDHERRHGHVRGPLHGIPILLKDNIATDDDMETTAGSLALVGSRVPEDATVAARLRAAGAVILGKSNLSEWASFRGFVPADFPVGLFLNGWSGRGGFTRDPYVLGWDPCGSSSGSAVGTAANLCAAAVGTETDGSVVCRARQRRRRRAQADARAGLPGRDHPDRPQPGHRRADGPDRDRRRSLLLNAMKSPFGRVKSHALPHDYTHFLRRGTLKGARIGVDRRLFDVAYFADPDLNLVTEQALTVMASLGATIVDPADGPDPFAFGDAELTVLLYEFKVDVAKYLRRLGHTSMRTLADLIAFNTQHCTDEMRYFGQELFELAEATTGLSDPIYRDARALCVDLTRRHGIDQVMHAQDLDAIAAPIYSFGSSAPAVAGYPNISVPTGITADGRPGGIWMYSGFLSEPRLLAFAYDLEQEIGGRPLPQYLDTVPALPPDAGICAVPLAAGAAPRIAGAARRVPAGWRMPRL